MMYDNNVYLSRLKKTMIKDQNNWIMDEIKI